MSFQNFDSFQNQHPAADAAAAAPGAPAPADTAMAGQDPTTGSFQGPAGEPTAAPVSQQGSDGKTTLWYVETGVLYGLLALADMTVIGWVSLSPGLMRTSFATSGSRWVSRSTLR